MSKLWCWVAAKHTTSIAVISSKIFFHNSNLILLHRPQMIIHYSTISIIIQFIFRPFFTFTLLLSSSTSVSIYFSIPLLLITSSLTSASHPFLIIDLVQSYPFFSRLKYLPFSPLLSQSLQIFSDWYTSDIYWSLRSLCYQGCQGKNY